MADEATQAEAGTPPAETAGETETSVTETAPVSTTPPEETQSDSTREVAGGVEGYLKEKEALLEAGKKKAKPEAPAKAAPETQTTTEEEKPATTTEEETAAPATTEEEEKTETVTETDTGDAAPAADDDKMPERIRIGAIKDRHLIAAAVNIAREEGISFKEAFDRIAPKPAAVSQRAVVRTVQPAATPASGTARTTQETRKPDIDVDSIRSVADYEKIKKKLIPGGRKLAPL